MDAARQTSPHEWREWLVDSLIAHLDPIELEVGGLITGKVVRAPESEDDPLVLGTVLAGPPGARLNGVRVLRDSAFAAFRLTEGELVVIRRHEGGFSVGAVIA